MPREQTFVESEIIEWKRVRGSNNRAYRKQLYRQYKKRFIDGHDNLLRNLAKHLTDASFRRKLQRLPRGRYIRDIHPRAFAFLAKYGEDFTPKMWRKQPSAEPQVDACFRNSWALMTCHNQMLLDLQRKGKYKKAASIVYVEGIVWGLFADPMLHAWNARGLNSKRAIDWTHYAGCNWTVYFGVALTEKQHDHLRNLLKKKRVKSWSLFHRKHFHHTEKYLKRVLSARKRTEMAA